ncbi:cation transporter [Psychrobacter sp. CAL346-MNA-CIBAN-0220]|uniref:heavy-metal-associated domain-containing protein n=1 Tax=Psychrobacter sp. CAL346-MNA-CIBAN-0220 TaxID=3140457 RepID=UPI003332F7C8
MAIKVAKVSIENIDDSEGVDSVMVALKNITGVTAIELDPATSTALIRYDDNDTSIHAFTAAISMVDYVTQPYPIDAPQNPRYNDEQS